jgi:hypothetical protein
MQTETDDKLIDACIDWAANKGAAYLAKEDRIVFFESATTRKQDEMWHRLSPAQVVRIIKTTKLPYDKQTLLKANHVIAAFQELGEIYDYGTESNVRVVETVFNYLERQDIPRDSQVMLAIAEELHQRGFHSLLYQDVIDVHRYSMDALGVNRVNSAVRKSYVHKYFPPLGYMLKIDNNRVMFKGKKKAVIMLSGKTIKSIQQMSEEDKQYIAHRSAEKYL